MTSSSGSRRLTMRANASSPTNTGTIADGSPMTLSPAAVKASRIFTTRFNNFYRSCSPFSDFTISKALVTVAACTGDSAFENVAEQP